MDFYEIRNVTEESADIFIYEQIGADWFGDGTTAKGFAEEMGELKVGSINLHINSPGGSVFDGQAIYNTLRNHPATVTTYIDGIAASIASVIALAGDKVIMAKNALYMIHDPAGGCMGGASDMRKMADVLDKVKDTIVGVYEDRTGATSDLLSDLMTAETWMNADEALEYGFADELAEDMQVAACFDFAALGFKHAPENVGRAISSDNEEKLTEARDLIDEVISGSEDDQTEEQGGSPSDSSSDMGGSPKHDLLFELVKYR